MKFKSIEANGTLIYDEDADYAEYDHTCRELVTHYYYGERECELIATWDGRRGDYDVSMCDYVYREPRCRLSATPQCARPGPLSTCST